MVIDWESMTSMSDMRKKLLESKEILRFLSECECSSTHIHCRRFSEDYLKASIPLMDAASFLDELIMESEDK